jgi:hypothetical protein
MLTDTAIRKAKPGEKPVKLSDEKGLFWKRSNSDPTYALRNQAPMRNAIVEGINIRRH